MATTTFCDIKLTEDVENYRYENKEYSWSEGAIVSLPYHTASKFVNRYNQAEYAKSPYEVKQEDYEYALGEGSGRNEDKDYCEVEKSDGEVCGREKPCPYHGEDE